MYTVSSESEYSSNEESKTSTLNEFEQKKVLDYMKLVRWVVMRLMNRLPRHIDAEDLTSTGMIGLIDAVRRFSWGRQKEDEEFRAYAECRIRGQIIDELRRQDALPRSTREKVNRFKKGYETLRQQLKAEPTDQVLCEHLKIDLETCHRLRAQMTFGAEVSFDAFQTKQTMEGLLLKTLQEVGGNTPESLLHTEEVKELLADAIAKLEERERQVVSLYYLEELTLKEIGTILSITESRVSQIHALAMTKLLKRLRKSLGLDFQES